MVPSCQLGLNLYRIEGQDRKKKWKKQTFLFLWLFLTVFPRLYLTEAFWTSGSSPGCKWIMAPTCAALSLFLHSPSAPSLRTCFLKAGLQHTYSLPIPLASHDPLIMFPSHHYVPSHFVSISTPPKESASSREAIACEQQAPYMLTAISCCCLQ